MATHDVGIVDQMQRRVIELVSGQVVRDERGGGYQTQAVPVTRQAQEGVLEDAALASQPPPTPQPASAPHPAPATRMEGFMRPAAPEEPPATGAITEVEPEVTNIRTAPPAPKVVPHVVPRTDELAPGSAEPTPLVPPPLNEPRRR
jgi:cell division transport system ATP-binding protein